MATNPIANVDVYETLSNYIGECSTLVCDMLNETNLYVIEFESHETHHDIEYNNRDECYYFKNPKHYIAVGKHKYILDTENIDRLENISGKRLYIKCKYCYEKCQVGCFIIYTDNVGGECCKDTLPQSYLEIKRIEKIKIYKESDIKKIDVPIIKGSVVLESFFSNHIYSNRIEKNIEYSTIKHIDFYKVYSGIDKSWRVIDSKICCILEYLHSIGVVEINNSYYRLRQ